jgi:hypothetical protein
MPFSQEDTSAIIERYSKDIKDSTILVEAQTAFLHSDFKSAIQSMNSMNLDDFPSQSLLVSTFNSGFFDVISVPFVQYLHDNNHGEDLLQHSWFKALSLIPQIISAFETHDNANYTQPDRFHSAKEKLICLAKAKELAHVYGLIEESVDINGTDFKLELSFPGVLAKKTMAHGSIFAQEFSFKQSPKYFNPERFLRDRKHHGSEEHHAVDFQLHPLTLSLNLKEYELVQLPSGISVPFIKEFVHLTSVVICESYQYGSLIALGDRGGNTKYRGVQIYQATNTAAIKEFITQIGDSLDKPIDEQDFSKLLKSLNVNLVHEIPCMEQLRGYCGFQSAGELNEFSLSLFSAMHNVHSKLGTPLCITDALETGSQIVFPYHLSQINNLRKSVLQETIDTLVQYPGVTIGQSFFDDLHLTEQRYDIPSTYRYHPQTSTRSSSDIPPAYQHYLKQQRYPRQTFTDHESLQITEAMDKLFSMFKKLNNDFDDELLFDMDTLDNKILSCYSMGFQDATTHHREAAMQDIELSRNNPFLLSNQMVCVENQIKDKDRAPFPAATAPIHFKMLP